MFGDDDLRAMESDFGTVLEWRGVEVGLCTLDDVTTNGQDADGFGVQRKVKAIRVRAGLLTEWKRDDVVKIGGTRYRLREKLDDARTIDGAWDLISVGVG